MANEQTPQDTTTTRNDDEELTWLHDESARLRETLAYLSTELGLPPTMGPAPGDLRRILAEGEIAITRLQEAPRGVSAEADFEAMTWTFKIGPACKTACGTYALVWMPND